MVNIDINELKNDLNHLAERGIPFKGIISYITGRYHGQENVPMEILDYALKLPTEITIIGYRPKQEAGGQS